jgi:hypothetical protein
MSQLKHQDASGLNDLGYKQSLPSGTIRKVAAQARKTPRN